MWIIEEKDADRGICSTSLQMCTVKEKRDKRKTRRIESRIWREKSEWIKRETLFEQEIEMSNKTIKETQNQ